MKRRTFLLISLLSSYSFATQKTYSDELKAIKASLEHMFPNSSKYNGAKTFDGFKYLQNISKHKSFDKSDMEFLIFGATKLLKYDRNFPVVSKNRKEKLLRKFENTDIGANWLSLLMYYGFEAMLSDPIYGGNKNMSGWKNIKHTPPIPMAKVKYARV
ncbi:MAG: hypothetical protein PQJ44_06595 [Sphaerochaetaceae bacterium]|nr:hypothetical protein [Sphaerochaetaceae bacterium]